MRVRVQAQYAIRLGRYLVDSGTPPSWLARRLDVPKTTLHAWLVGRAVVPASQRARILEVLRERQALPVGDDLFETED